MAEHLLDGQAPPATPSAGQAFLYPDNGSKQFASKDDTGKVLTLGGIMNQSTALQTGFAADTYLIGSALAIPQHKLQIGTRFRWLFDVTKTGAGVATPTVIIRVGTAGSTADTARVTFTFPAQTAVIDNGLIEVIATMRGPLSASGILAAVARLTHNVVGQITGLSTSESPILSVQSAGFDVTAAGLIVGLSVNGGASAAWTTQIVQSSMENI